MGDESNQSKAADSFLALTPKVNDKDPYGGRTFSICKKADKYFEVHKVDCKCKKTWTPKQRWFRADTWEEAVEKARAPHRRETFRVMGCTMAVTGCSLCGKRGQGAVKCFESEKWLCRECGNTKLLICPRRRAHRFLPEYALKHERWCKRLYGI